MSNYKMIYNTLYNSIKFFNNINILPSKTIHLDTNTGNVKLNSFYEFTDPKTICFDIFRIQNMLDEASETIYTYKQLKLRTIIVKLVISILLEELVIDKNKYNSYEEIKKVCYIESTRIIANNFKKTRNIIGALDITNDADIILNNKKFYKKENL